MTLDTLLWSILLLAWCALGIPALRGEAKRAEDQVDVSGVYGPAQLRFTWWSLWWASALVAGLIAWAAGVSPTLAGGAALGGLLACRVLVGVLPRVRRDASR